MEVGPGVLGADLIRSKLRCLIDGLDFLGVDCLVVELLKGVPGLALGLLDGLLQNVDVVAHVHPILFVDRVLLVEVVVVGFGGLLNLRALVKHLVVACHLSAHELPRGA